MSFTIASKQIVMAAARISHIKSRAVGWGDGLGIRITKPLAEGSGIDLNSVLLVSAQPGRIVIKVRSCRLSLNAMPAAFDPKRHASYATALSPVGREVL